MYTRCPRCLTVFVVGAEQLKAAHGNVRCGTCFESFDAIPHLSDGPAQSSAAPQEAAVEDVEERRVSDPDARDQFFDDALDDAADNPPDPVPDDVLDWPGDPVPGDARIASERLSSTLDAVRAAASLGDGVSMATEPAFESKQRELEPATADSDGAPEEAGDDDLFPAGSDEGEALHVDPRRVAAPLAESDESLPEVLREEVDEAAARAAARRRNIGFGAAALALVLLLAGQYVFFMPDDAARRYPQWRGAIESVCVQIGCVLPEHQDPSRIRVISRDVRVHPRYEGVLQIKATLSNAAPYRQPYPRVRFTLFNVNGQTIATRVFRPSEYLGRSVASSARLRPETPFQVELDVLAPEQAAVSFEFQFL